MHTGVDHPGSRKIRLVLVVEDEFLVAMDIGLLLERNGHSVLGPATTIDEALRLLERAVPDVAVLDVNIGGGLVFPVAARLRRLQVPFVVASAYASVDFVGSEALGNSERIVKPIGERDLLAAIDRALAAA